MEKKPLNPKVKKNKKQKKRLLCIILVVLSIAFCSCSGSDTNQEKIENYGIGEATLGEVENETNVEESTIIETTVGDQMDETEEDADAVGEVTVNDEEYGSFDKKAVAKQIKVTPYIKSSSYYGGLALELKNNSKYDCNLEITVTFYNKKNKKVSDDHGEISVFASGTKMALTFSCYKKFKRFKYEIKTAKILDYYSPITQKLSSNVKIKTGKSRYSKGDTIAFVTVKNNGKRKIRSVKAYALFFKGKKYIDSNYMPLFNIKPKKTKSVEIYCHSNKEFDSVKVFLDGYELNL